MIAWDVGIGQAVQIGESRTNGVVVKVARKSGARVRLYFETALSIRLLPDGLVPAHFTAGITGEPRRILEPIQLRA